jgi:hypothetical protein
MLAGTQPLVAAGTDEEQSMPVPGAVPVLSAETSELDQPEVRVGEKLDPETAFGPAVIESMDQVMERERANPSPTHNRKTRNGAQGSWAVPSTRSSFHAHSGDHYLINKWGDTLMGIEFQREVDFTGAWIAGHAASSLWADGVRFIGYRGSERVGESPWLENLKYDASWLAADFERVDRLEVEARAVYQGGGWYALDDLTFEERPASAFESSRQVVIDFDDLSYNTRVSGSGYAGLVWPVGTGDFDREVFVVHPPVTPPGAEMDDIGADSTAMNSFFGGNGTAPTMTNSFAGPKLGDAGAGWLPPDTCGSVGPDHFVAVVNQNLSVYDKVSGSRLVNTGLANFWGTGSSAGDPRAVWDPHSQRYFIIATDFNTRLWFAMSLTDDATGSWFKTSINLSQGSDSGHWPDYPTLGVDANGVYSASYMVGSGSPMSLFAIDKAPLVDGSPNLGTVTAFRGLPWEGAIQPCVTYGNPGRAYCVSRRSSTTMRLRYVQGPMNNPTLVEVGNPTIPNHSGPPNAPALGSVAPLDALDWRPMNAVYRNGSVWTTHGVNSGGRAACRWYEFDASSATTVQSGTVNDSSMNYMIPSIAVNADDAVVVSFSGSNASTYGSSYFAGRTASDPLGQLSDPVLLKAGNAPYNTVDSSGVNRWGDYSLTSIDPDDDTTLWTIQEHTRSEDVWGTRIAKLEFPIECDDPVNYCLALSNSVGPGASISHIGSASLSANDLQLSVSGLPIGTTGLIYYGPNQIAVLFGDGLRCVGGGVIRLSPIQSDIFGFVNVALDLTSAPFDAGPGAAIVGETKNFQHWYRDPTFGNSGYNLSDGLSVTFCP